jgi:PAS domain S-box-containing protein
LLSIVRDISERKRAERALIESHNLNESLLQTIPFGMDIVDQAGTILFANEKLHALVGVDLRAHTCWQMYKDDQTQCADCSLKQPIAPGETRIIETAGVLGGKIFAIHHTGMIYQGKPAILEVFQEITETKRAEQILRDSEERYRLLFHEMLNGFALHEIIRDADGAPVDYRFLEANPAFERLTGLRAAAIIGKTVREVIPGIEPEWIAKYGRVALTGEPIQFENYASALGKYYHVTAFSPRVGQFAVIFEDVTQRQVAEERTNQLGQILEESLNEIYIFDAQTLRFIQVNRGARENLGYSMGELRELTPLDLKPEFTPAIFAAHLEPLRTHEREQIQFTTIHRRKNGTTYPVEVSLQLANLGSVPVFVAIILDITARQQRERELEAIASISAALRAAHARAEMLPIILDQVAGLIPLEGAAIGLLNELTGDLIIEQARGVWAAAIGRRTPSDQGITHQVLSTGKPYVTTDLPNDPLMYWRDLIQTANAMATVPLATQNAVIGWIGIGAKHNFSETDLRVLTAIADIAANAIRRSALHEQTKRHLDRITALGIIDRAINASLDLRIVLNILLDQAVTHLRADAAAMLLFNRAAQTLEWRAERGMRASHLTAVPVRLGGDATSRAILERRALHIPDLGMHSDAPARAALLASEEFVSYYAVPLIAKGVVKGVLEIFHRAPHIGDAEWEGFMQSLAEQAAIALDNAELFNGLERANDELVMAYDATIEGWSRALDLRDKETEGHSQRVTEMTIRLARALNIPDSQLTLIRRGALLHDIGKMGIPDAILLKPGPLSEKEWEIMRLHPAYAHELLSGISYLGNALDIPYCHHEKWDGTGYPRGLAGETIPVAARIFALADVWDALSSERPYRAAWPPDRVIAYIREQPGKHFDPAVVAAFLNLTRGE